MFRIIPVLDLKNSIVVHAIRGKRTLYKPITSKIINTTDPLKISALFKNQYDLREQYIADLDSIQHRKPNLDIIQRLLKEEDLQLILDPGLRSEKDLELYASLNLKALILALESIKSIEVIDLALELLGSERIILSFDLFKNKILTKIEELKNKSHLRLIKMFEDMGIKELILLDLFRVGQKLGGIPQNYINIKNNFKGRVLVGGGIKNIRNLIEYYKEGFSGVLIATSLHDETIKREDLKEFRKRILKS